MFIASLTVVVIGYFTDIASNVVGWSLFYAGPLLFIGLGMMMFSLCGHIFIFKYRGRLLKRGGLTVGQRLMFCVGNTLFLVGIVLLIFVSIV